MGRKTLTFYFECLLVLVLRSPFGYREEGASKLR